ncbi:hypothetical protein [Mycobacterium sherrisii]|uniref:TetR family transcriptional regulator n=1 Tax=Mycobacterium sherrisii TaxID=243061 RepID=A0A1E3SV96_9MYCO|nr:hypothetical protein [Mycobacterium sherrisii]MCV7028828.1 hypothetical protein [Mycobacterium sherrisii]MEC4761762.1 hypothetical protein [Mycobacterium sherrisii]ODR05543.1 hypothetical protein BHQ21_13975 [Mycobacterium sherrisii]ORW82633.1 hypothetical protein AWC25_01650 [Mycobacterium sherrisii]
MSDEGVPPEPTDLRIWASLLEAATTVSLGKHAVTPARVRRWHDQIATAIHRLQRDGKTDRAIDAVQTAAALLAGVQGGAEILLATGDPSFLEAAIDDAVNMLRLTRE